MLGYMVLATLLFAVHLTAGILAVRYSAIAPKFMNVYGIAALLMVVANIAVTGAVFPEGLPMVVDDWQGGRILIEVVAAPWPIVVLALMNTRGARDACKKPSVPRAVVHQEFR